MAYSDDFTAANDGALRQKVWMAMHSAALAIVGETPSSNNKRDEKRHQLGVSVLNADFSLDQALLDRFMFAAVANGSLTTSSTDGAIDTRVAAIWNDLAGVTGSE